MDPLTLVGLLVNMVGIVAAAVKNNPNYKDEGNLLANMILTAQGQVGAAVGMTDAELKTMYDTTQAMFARHSAPIVAPPTGGAA